MSCRARILFATPKYCKGCIKVVCRFFRGIFNRFLGKFQSEFFLFRENFLYIFRLFDSGFNLFQINEFEFAEKTTYNLYKIFTVFRCQGRYAKNLKKKFSKICHRMRHRSYKMRQKNYRKISSRTDFINFLRLIF